MIRALWFAAKVAVCLPLVPLAVLVVVIDEEMRAREEAARGR